MIIAKSHGKYLCKPLGPLGSRGFFIDIGFKMSRSYCCWLVLLALAIPGYAQKAYINIALLKWSPEEKIFSFSGKSELPDGTELKVILTLNKHVGPVQIAVVKDFCWEGTFGPYIEKEVVAGEYILVAEVNEMQSVPEIQNEIEKLRQKKKGLKATKSYSHRLEEKKKEWDRYKNDIIAQVMATQPHFAKMLQQGYPILAKSKGASQANKQKYGNEWLKIYLVMPDFEAIRDELLWEREGILIHPYEDAFTRLIEFLELLQQLKFSLSVDIGNVTDVTTVSQEQIKGMLLPPNILTKSVVQSAGEILKLVGCGKSYWTGKIPQ